MADFWLQNPEDYSTAFDADWEVAEWTAETAGAPTITLERYTDDDAHPSCMKVTSNTDGSGVYMQFETIAETAYRTEFSYVNTTPQELDVLIWDATSSATIVSEVGRDEIVWSNFCQDFTTPANCTAVIVYLRAGTNEDIAFYVDDFLTQGNALLRSPDTYSAPKLDTRRTHTMVDGSKVIDRTARFTNARLKFNLLEKTQFDELLGVAKASTPTWFDDGDVPQMVKEGVLYTETTYTFSGITNPSGTHKSWYTITERPTHDFPVAETDFQGTEMTTGNYTNLAVDDNNGPTTSAVAGVDLGEFIYHKFDFYIAGEYSYITDVQKINIQWRGKGVDGSGKNNNGVVLYVWNGTNWVELGRSRVADYTRISYTNTWPEQVQEFVDPPNGRLRLLVRTMARHESGSTLSLQSTYVKVVINEDYDTTVWLQNKAKLSSGDVVEVKNLTQGTTLSLGADYVISDDREGVVTSGQAAGDKVRVTYNQEYQVVMARKLGDDWYGTGRADVERSSSFELESLVGLE